MILPVFKAGDPALRGSDGGFDSHTLPPTFTNHPTFSSLSVAISTFVLIHLFLDALIVVPAAFVLAFGTRSRLAAFLAPVALGVGSAMVLDEVTYLVATKGTNQDYVSSVFLRGAIVFISLAAILLLVLYRIPRPR